MDQNLLGKTYIDCPVMRLMGLNPVIIDGRAIDPLALLLPGPVYIKVTDWKHPHVPKVAEIRAALKEMTPQDRMAALDRAGLFIEIGKIFEEAGKK